MSTFNCPSCKNNAFSWYLDEETTPLTIWGCFACGYTAYEDETMQRQCYGCNKDKIESLLQDEVKTYWWCCRCDTVKDAI